MPNSILSVFYLACLGKVATSLPVQWDVSSIQSFGKLLHLLTQGTEAAILQTDQFLEDVSFCHYYTLWFYCKLVGSLLHMHEPCFEKTHNSSHESPQEYCPWFCYRFLSQLNRWVLSTCSLTPRLSLGLAMWHDNTWPWRFGWLKVQQNLTQNF